MRTLQVIQNFYRLFFGNGGFGILLIGALLFLLFRRQTWKEDKEMAAPAALILCVILCPLTAWVIIRGIGQDVYWRVFWMLPLAAVIAYALTQAAELVPAGKKRAGIVILMGLALALNGSLVLGEDFFTPRENNYKLPQRVIEVVDVINDHAERIGLTKKLIAAPQDITVYARLYDASIRQKQGRNIAFDPDRQTELYDLVNADAPDVDRLAELANQKRCRYVVVKETGGSAARMEAGGFEHLANAAGYGVYFNRRYYKSLERKRLKGIKVYVRKRKFPAGKWTVTQYGARDMNAMFYTIYNPDEGLIVVDGGWAEDEDFVRKVILRLGSHVNAWIITHPHQDHCGAFNAIWADRRNITIDAVYTTPMATPEECLAVASWDDTTTYEDFLALDIPSLHYLQRGDELEILNLRFQVLNAFDEQVRELSKDYLNDGSLMFKVTGPERSMLFCGDVGKSMSKYILSTYKNLLPSDYVQMGHHGNGGLKANFYRQVAPSVAFFDAPDWLMEDPEGKYGTPEKIELMQELGAEILSFGRRPNSRGL